jgi:predicted Ser/Thr protein kinase
MMEKKFGDFEILEEIGKGGMGQVYKARQISLDRDVAIKVLPADLGDVEEFRERFDVEAKAVASLMHENILQIYSKGVTDEGIHYFAMEYVDGEDLADKIKRGVSFTEAEAIDIAVQVCRGLEAARKKNIIHRDIKPSNIMVTKNGTVKIADFGLAKSLNATKKLTQTNMYMGTVAYTSPEQGEGKPLDHRTDIYSLGIVLYQLLTGSVPFTAETPSSVIFKHVYEAPPAPRTINPRISAQAEAVVLKAIAKKPEDRFQNAVEFRNALESVNKTHPDAKAEAARQAPVFAARQETTPLGGAGTKARRNALFLIIAVALILLVGGPALYAAKYGYKALFSKVFPSAAQEEKKVEQALPPAEEAATPPAPETGVPTPEPQKPSEGASAVRREMTDIPPAVSSRGATRYGSGTAGPEETAAIPAAQPKASKRPAMPAVLVVTSGEANISDIVESVIGKKLKQRSFPLSTADDLQALAGRYGRHKIPLNELDRSRSKADVLVYVAVNTMNAGPLEFYGQTMEQYASTISIRVIDTATKRAIVSTRTKTVNYTTLNMQDNIEEATGELVSDLPKKLITFWKG